AVLSIAQLALHTYLCTGYTATLSGSQYNPKPVNEARNASKNST
ncbi:unnamed protein product, partial [Amoebophrya sp. A25]